MRDRMPTHCGAASAPKTSAMPVPKTGARARADPRAPARMRALRVRVRSRCRAQGSGDAVEATWRERGPNAAVVR